MRGSLKKDITLELERGGIQARFTARQGDSLVHGIRIKLTCGGKSYASASAVTQVYGIRPDGETVVCDCKSGAGGVEFIPGGGFFACGGPVICRLVLRGDDGGELYSPAFAIDAEPAFAYGVDPVPAEEYSRMEELLLQVLDAKRACERLVAEINGVTLSDDSPLVNGTGTAGTATAASRADHVHPADPTRMPADLDSLNSARGFADGMLFPAADTNKNLRKVTWSRFKDEIKKAVSSDTAAAIETAFENTVVSAAYAVSDANGVRYAFLPEGMTNDEILALRSDIENIPTEEWIFTLADGTTVTKKVMLG